MKSSWKDCAKTMQSTEKAPFAIQTSLKSITPRQRHNFVCSCFKPLKISGLRCGKRIGAHEGSSSCWTLRTGPHAKRVTHNKASCQA